MSQSEQVPISSLSHQQLMDLRQSLEQEVQGMAQNGMTLQSTAAKFGAAGQAVSVPVLLLAGITLAAAALLPFAAAAAIRINLR